MHNIKKIRNNFDEFKKLIKTRNIEINIDQIAELDKKNRQLIQEKENLESKKKAYLRVKINLYLKNLKIYPLKLTN